MAQQIEVTHRERKAIVNPVGQLSVFLGPAELAENEVKYKEVAAGSTETIWTPETGKAIQLAGLIISMDATGSAEVIFDSTVKTHLEFAEKKAVPLPINYAVCVGLNKSLRVSATGAKAYVSAIGFECTPS